MLISEPAADLIDRVSHPVDNAAVISGSQEEALLRGLVVSERTLLDHPLYGPAARAIVQDAERDLAALTASAEHRATDPPDPSLT